LSTSLETCALGQPIGYFFILCTEITNITFKIIYFPVNIWGNGREDTD